MRGRGWVMVLVLAASGVLILGPAHGQGTERPPAGQRQESAPETAPAPRQQQGAPQPQPQGAAQEGAQQQDAAQREAAAAQPGPVHEAMGRRVGDYTVVNRFRSAPDAAPQESSGTAKISAALGGRFLLEEDSIEQQGQNVATWRLWGYNNGSQRYESVWVWALSTGVLTLSGTSKDGGKTIDWTGTYDDASGERRSLQGRTTQPDDDHFTIGLFGPGPDGKPFVVVETEYTRAQPAPGGG